MSVASDLVDRLSRHYVKPSKGGGIFVPEVGTNDWGATGSRCDAIYIGFTSTSGKLLVGHEVKVSRADWLHELDQPGKADFWHNACHAWYVVAPGPGIVRVEELPPGWGLMLPNTRSSVRFDIVAKATVKDGATHDPGWLAVRSIFARLDTLRAGDVHRQVRTEVEKLQREHTERLDQLTRQRVESTHDPDTAQAIRLVKELRQRLLRRQVWVRPTDEQVIAALLDVLAVQHAAEQMRSVLRPMLDSLNLIVGDAQLDQMDKAIAAATEGDPWSEQP